MTNVRCSSKRMTVPRDVGLDKLAHWSNGIPLQDFIPIFQRGSAIFIPGTGTLVRRKVLLNNLVTHPNIAEGDISSKHVANCLRTTSLCKESATLVQKTPDNPLGPFDSANSNPLDADSLGSQPALNVRLFRHWFREYARSLTAILGSP